MKTFKYLLCMFVAMAVGLASCSDDIEYTPGTVPSGQEVYFPENVTTMYSISDDVTSIAIPVSRVAKDEALTVAILSDDASGLFTIPSTVVFAAGKETAELLMTFNRTKLEDGKEYPLEFMINDDNNTTPYGNRSIKITVAPWPWESLGKGKLRDDWFNSLYTVGNPEIEVNIHEHKSKKGVYMIEKMYGWPFLTAFFNSPQDEIEAKFVTYTPTDITIDCRNPSKVVMPRQFTGIADLDPGYGKCEIAMFQGKEGTLENGIITFPTGGLALVCVAGNAAANKSGLFRIILPGFKAVDYSLSAAYGGMKVSADNETTSAVIDFGYGNDVTGINYVFAAGDVTANADKIAAEIIAGTAKNVYEVKNFVKGSKKTSIEAEMTAGMVTVVALPKDETGKLLADQVTATSFYFPGTGGVPECDVEAKLMRVSEFNPELLGQFPDHSSIACMVSGTDLTEVKYYINKTAVIAQIEDGSLGVTVDQIMANATALTAKQLETLATNGNWGGIFSKRIPETSYTVLVQAKNKYGKTALIKSDPAAPAAVPYSGELAIGEYYMRYQADADNLFENVFNVQPTVGSDTKFYVYDIGTDDGSVWHATYDPTASTLTLSGLQVGYEDDGNLFGDILGYWNAAETQGYGFYSFANEESKGADPLVITVDKTNKKPSKLNTQLQVPVLDLASSKLLGYAGFYPFDTPITPNASSSGVAAKAKIQNVRAVNIPFSSIQVPANTKSKLNKRFRVATAETVKKNYTSDNVVRTLNVKTAQCEPLPKKAGRVANLKESVNLQIVK